MSQNLTSKKKISMVIIDFKKIRILTSNVVNLS